MKEPISFYFSASDPAFETTTVVVQDEPYISHAFVNCPIYDFAERPIGYKVSDDYVQQVDDEKYIVRLNNTYYFDTHHKKGSVSWQYCFISKSRDIYYPVNIPANSTIISGTGDFYGLTGSVTLFPKSDKSRLVTISFDN